MPVDTTGSESAFQSHEEVFEDDGLWSNYSHIDLSQCQMEVMMELNQREGTFDHSEATHYGLLSNCLSENSRTNNLDSQHLPRDALRHINEVEEATAPPYEYLSNDPSCNMFTEQSGLSEVKCQDTGVMLGSTGQEGNHFTPMNMFPLLRNTAIRDISYTELNIGEVTGSMHNGNSSCLTVQGGYQQGEFGEYPQPEYGSLDMAGERSLHDLPQNNQSYDMEQFPQNICETGSMQVGSPDQYCDDTSLSDYYMDVSSPESLSCEQNQSEDICFRSESSTDSSPVPSSRNSITEDADKYLGDTTKQLPNSKIVPFSNQHPFKNRRDQMPPAFHKQYDMHRSGNSSIQGNSSRSCFSVNGNGDSDLCIIEGNSNPAPGHLLPLQGELHHNFQQSVSANPILPRFGGMRYKPHDERITLRLALQDFSQPKAEASPPDGVLAVPLLRHQKIALSWMVQKETSGSHCSGGILADDQGLGKTVSTISLILTERSPLPLSSAIKQEPCEAVTLDDDDLAEPRLERATQACSPEVASTTVKTETHIVQVKTRPAAGTLVVCPTSVLRQWAEELRNKVTSKANLTFLVYHGSNRTKDPNELTKYDVVLTTYSIVSMEVPKQSNLDSDDEEKGKPDRYGAPVGSSGSKKRKASSSKKTKNGSTTESSLPDRPLAKVAWFRVILDEAFLNKCNADEDLFILHVMIQSLWNLRHFRDIFLRGPPIWILPNHDKACIAEVFYEILCSLEKTVHNRMADLLTSVKTTLCEIANDSNIFQKLQVGKFFASEIVGIILKGLHLSENSEIERQVVNPISCGDCICQTHNLFGIKYYVQMSCRCGKRFDKKEHTTIIHKLDAGSPQTTKIKSFAELLVLLDEQLFCKGTCEHCGSPKKIDLFLSNTPHFFTIGSVLA